MSYRDETEGLRAKVESLEGELADAKQRIARLKGEEGEQDREAAPQEPNAERSGFFDEALRLRLEEELPSSVSEEGFEAIAEALRKKLPSTVVPSQVGSTLSVRAPTFNLSLKNTPDGRARILLEGTFHDLRNGGVVLTGALGLLGTLFGGGIAASVGLPPESILWILPAALTGGGVLGRYLGRRIIEGQRKEMRALFETTVAVARDHPSQAAPAPRARVAPAEDSLGEDSEAKIAAVDAEEEAEPASMG